MFNFLKKDTAKKFGYKKDQSGIINRYLREKKGWDKHLQQSKEFLVKNMKLFPDSSVVVLGSGWLLDVPLDDLASYFGKVYLVDIFHPTQVQHITNRFSNVERIKYDITGGLIEEIESHIQHGRIGKAANFPVELLTSKPIHFGLPDNVDVGMVISLNLLNQLDILLCDYITKKLDLQPEHLLKLRQFIQQTHLDSLLEKKGVLITDYVQIAKQNNEIVHNKPLVHIELPEGENTKEWLWEFDNSGMYIPKHQVHFKVKAMVVR